MFFLIRSFEKHMWHQGAKGKFASKPPPLFVCAHCASMCVRLCSCAIVNKQLYYQKLCRVLPPGFFVNWKCQRYSGLARVNYVIKKRSIQIHSSGPIQNAVINVSMAIDSTDWCPPGFGGSQSRKNPSCRTLSDAPDAKPQGFGSICVLWGTTWSQG